MKSDRMLAVVLMLFALAVFLYARNWQIEAGLYPRAIAVLIFVLSGLLFIKPQDKTKKTFRGMLSEAWSNRRILFVLALTVAFVASIEYIGFFVGLPIYLVAVQLLMGSRSVKSIALSTVLITAVIYLIFVVMLSIRIPIAFWMN
ncbi:MAG: tripartite tricarboxylate transporter TctB family protein [Clostridia bacterium]|nr:tripartite tricarboxylate transporter TctB family protein [Clostridia bacterium]